MESTMSRILQTTLAVILGIAVFLVVGVLILASFTTVSIASCSFASGRAVSVHSKWGAGMSNTADTVTINAAGHEIVVAPKYLQVDGKRLTKIDPATKSIEVNAARGEITFVGDGQTMAIWRR
jgi:hypothetical protein